MGNRSSPRELRWTEEIIDQVNHSVYSIGIEPKFFLGDRSAITLAAGCLGTGPIQTDLAEAGELTENGELSADLPSLPTLTV